MAEYMNEQEQVELIKDWWKRYGNWVVGLIFLAVMVIVGWQYWHHREEVVKQNASVVYQRLVVAMTKNNATLVDANANLLRQQYPRTTYARLAALLMAGVYANQGKLNQAAAELTWVKAHADSKEMKAIASLRLARILLAQRQPLKAMEQLKQDFPKAFAGQVWLLKGQIYQAAGNKDAAARHAFQSALALSKDNPGLKSLAKMQLSQLPAESNVKTQPKKQKGKVHES